MRTIKIFQLTDKNSFHLHLHRIDFALLLTLFEPDSSQRWTEFPGILQVRSRYSTGDFQVLTGNWFFQYPEKRQKTSRSYLVESKKFSFFPGKTGNWKNSDTWKTLRKCIQVPNTWSVPAKYLETLSNVDSSC